MAFWGWVESVLGLTFQLNADDIVVFVVGPSGGGKTWFVQEVTGRQDLVQVGRTLKPCTKKVAAVKCKLKDTAKLTLGVLDQNHIVFVDTPSFLTGTDETKVEKNTRRWLKSSKSKSTLVGTIYVDRLANDPNRDRIQEHLNRFAFTVPNPQDVDLCPLRLRGILSYNSREGVIDPTKAVVRKTGFQEQLRGLEKSLFSGRGKLKWDASYHPECVQENNGEAWKAVVELFSTRPDLR